MISSNKNTQTLYYPLYWGMIIFGILFILSIAFYIERIGFFDNAFQLFLLIHEGKITVMADRWPDVIIRFLPWLGMKAGLPLKVLMMLFSISYIFIHFILYLLTYALERQRIWSTLLICCLSLGVSDSFYWCSSELIHGLSWLMLMMALYFRQDRLSWPYGLILILLSIICVSLHPLIIFPFVFILLFQFINSKKSIAHALMLGSLFFGFWLIKTQVLGNWYDDAKSAEFFGNLNQFKSDLWNIPSHLSFINESFVKYQMWVILLIVNVFYLIKQKKRGWAGLLIFFICAYILMIHIGNPITENSFYREVSYLPLSIFLGFVFLIQIQESVKAKFYLKWLYILIVFSLIRIYIFHIDYTARKNWLLDITNDHSCSNWIVNEEYLDLDRIKMAWALPYESLVLSTAFQGQSASLKSSPHPQSETKNAIDKGLFLNPFTEIKVSELNPSYFKLKAEKYCQLK